MKSLSQFQALQDGEKELASLRELGLNDTEIQLWQSRDAPETAEKVKHPRRTERRLQTAEAVECFHTTKHVVSPLYNCVKDFSEKVSKTFFFWETWVNEIVEFLQHDYVFKFSLVNA